MASRVMHLAVAKRLKESIHIKDENRFDLGCILPDAYSSKATVEHNSHYKEWVCNGQRKTYNLGKFRGEFEDELLRDDLYLGYYLHLIQDIVYRGFVYNDYKWNPRIPGNIQALHNDYALLNTYVVEKYQLEDELTLPADFEEERINNIYGFCVQGLVDDLKGDFRPYDKGNLFFFSRDMVDEYIERAVRVCLNEVEALRRAKPLLNAMDYAWK